jgi:uncharacterized membrane protein
MLKFALAAAAALVTVQAQAEVYSCGWTEPFISFEYDSSTGTAQVIDATATFPTEIKNVSLRIVTGDKFELVGADGTVYVEMDLGGGSDGMSDTVYPFNAINKNVPGVPADYLGGCSSTSLPSFNPEK